VIGLAGIVDAGVQPLAVAKHLDVVEQHLLRNLT
jgi:hypothetical protein